MKKEILISIGITILFLGAGIQPAFAISNNGNNPPYAPIIDGPSSAEPSRECYFTFNSTDPDDDYVIYQIDWGDGTNDETPLFPSGEPVGLYHAFPVGRHLIRAWAVDIYGAKSICSKHEIIIFYIPSKPAIDGPTNGKIGELYDYEFVSTIPGNNEIWYFIDWGDGTYSRWIGPYVSGEEVIKSHRWFICKTYAIRAKAKNVYDVESNWSEHEIIIPRTRTVSYLWFEWLLECFPLLERLLGLIK